MKKLLTTTVLTNGENKVFDYIKAFYDVLHSTGQEYIVEDIDLYISSRQN
jgi:hypothetical protein